MFGIQWVMPNTIVSLLFAWRNWLGTYSSKVWNMVPACLMWLVWKERNAQTFEDIERPIDMLKNLLARTLFEWSCIWGLAHCSSLSDFLIFVRLSLWFDCKCFKGSKFTIVNTLLLFIYKTLFIYQKKKNDGERLHVITFIFAINLIKHTWTIFICSENPFINEVYQHGII